MPTDPNGSITPFPAFAAHLADGRSPLREAIAHACRADEETAVRSLLAKAGDDPAAWAETQTLARRLIEHMRSTRSRAAGIDALMHEFSLSSEEGIALMCVAEALLRIPDRETADRLIADKIARGDWHRHLGASPSPFVNAATWGLLVTGKLLSPAGHSLGAALTQVIAKGGEPLIRKGMDLAMRTLGNQFVAGRTIAEALDRSGEREAHGYRHSYDMLGEAALTAADAHSYYHSYEAAIHAIGAAARGHGIRNGPGISVKLSALHPRYERAQRERVMLELLPRLKQLLLLAKQYDIGINIDAEEADRLELSLDLMEALACDPDLASFDGIGFVVQAYQKRCPHVIDHLIDLARRHGRRFMIRLVKGAYWDTEIKRAQFDGLPGYPVFTRKAHTDLCYQVCAQQLLAATDAIYPQFATHNALTLSAIVASAQTIGVTDYEFQCLHGMGEALSDHIVGADGLGIPCRIYAPVGSHEILLPYLVRRLLENGANSSFVHRIVDPQVGIDELLRPPASLAAASGGAPHPDIALPAALFGSTRRNSSGYDLADERVLRTLADALYPLGHHQWHAQPVGIDTLANRSSIPLRNPANHADMIGTVQETDAGEIESAFAAATAGAGQWQAVASDRRADILQGTANLFEQHAAELIALLMREAGKTLPNSIGELREAVDFLRYYGDRIRNSGDRNNSQPLGVVACISPWNFPLSIFIGQAAAALAAGNAVLAKPAEQTPLIAFRVVQLLHEAGVPHNALLFLPGRGETVGAQLVADSRTDGVVFTGSTSVARHINALLAQRAVNEQRTIPLIAETGGQNAMIVDSSALCEQVVRDVLLSAFDAAGQRCSALRVLCLQEDIADHTLAMLHGAMQELRLGPPDYLSTDVGPVVDSEARQHLTDHVEQCRHAGHRVTQLALPASANTGTFFAPAVIEIEGMNDLRHEAFGPVLHVLRYPRDTLAQLIADINATGYGLTLGIHSRIDETIRFITEQARVGNVYVNHNMIGAVVGVQPFGGEGLSGTGPKAGGPLYLPHLQQDADVTPTAIGMQAAAMPGHEVFQALLQWSDAHDPGLAALCRCYVTESLCGRALPLPGPTGESNILQFFPRGTVLCAAVALPTLLNQLAAVLATGNRPLMLHANAALLPPDLPDAVHGAIMTAPRHQDCPELAFALLDAGCLSLLPDLASRDGAIVSTLLTIASEPLAVWRLAAEKAVCINTAAAGGNTDLMTMTA